MKITTKCYLLMIMLRLISATLFLLLITFFSFVSVLNQYFVLLYFIMSLVSFVIFAYDKHAAIKGQSRTRERTLLTLMVFCGWPGALFAQSLLHHKSTKTSFIKSSLFSISFNLILLLLFIYQA